MTQELDSYRSKFENEFFNILEYWNKNAVENEDKGFYGAVNLNNEAVPSANKTCVLNVCILWAFASASMAYPGKGYKKIADLADEDMGGFYMELSSQNEVVNDIKHTYPQVLNVYSFSRYYDFNKDEASMIFFKHKYHRRTCLKNIMQGRSGSIRPQIFN